MVAAWSLASAFVVAAAGALVLTSLAARHPTSRTALRAHVRRLPVAIAARRALARLDLAGGRARAAGNRLDAAVRAAPFSATLRLERADVALRTGDRAGARRAAAAALRRAPVDAGVCERAGLVLLEADAPTAAAAALRRALTYEPTRATRVYDGVGPAYDDDAFVVANIVPADADGARRFLGWAYERRLPGAAAVGWRALAARTPSTADVVRHVDFLLEHADVATADAVWSAAFGARPAGIVVDGGFESDVVDGGFGWHLARTPGVRMEIAGADAAAAGRRGLAIEFTGGNVDLAAPSQVVPVGAERRYRLTARMRSEGLTSLAGPRLAVEGHPACPGFGTVAGPELRGSRPWDDVALEFTTPPGCAAVRVLVRRAPSTRLDRDLRGRLWLDDVRLAAIDDRKI